MGGGIYTLWDRVKDASEQVRAALVDPPQGASSLLPALVAALDALDASLDSNVPYERTEVYEAMARVKTALQPLLSASPLPAPQEPAASPFAAHRVADLVKRLRDSSGSHINGLYDREAADALEEMAQLADSEGSRAVKYLRRARKAESAAHADQPPSQEPQGSSGSLPESGIEAGPPVTHLDLCASQDDTMRNYPRCDCGAISARDRLIDAVGAVLRDAMTCYPGSRETPDYAVEVALWLRDQDEAREYQPLPEADAWPLGPAVPFFGPEKMRSYVDADRKARQQEAVRYMPIMGTPLAMPFDLLDERQAQINHGGQSLARLAERGGLDPGEALAIVKRERWDRYQHMKRPEVLSALVAAIAKREPRP
jgi:hypothetical protein